jgi:acyl carrier protein
MMTPEKIKENLTEIFRDVLDNNSIVLSRETTADDIEEWDSLSQISLLVAIEKEFKIKLDFNEVKQLQNVGDMLDLVERKIS